MAARLPMLACGVAFESPGGVLGQYEIGLPAIQLALGSAGVANVGAADHRRCATPGTSSCWPPRTSGRHQLGVQGQDPAMLGERFVPRGERTILDFIPFQDRLGLQQLFDVRRIVDARKLHQQLRLGVAASGGLHGRFSQAQGVDLALDGGHGLSHGVLLELQGLGGLHGQLVVAGIQRCQDPVAELIVHDAAKRAALVARNSFDVDLDLVGVFQRRRIVPRDVAGGADAVFLKLLLQAFDGVVRESLEGVLELDLHHQLRAAAQIEPEMDVLFPVGDQLVFRFGNSDDAVQAYQDDRDDDGGFDLEVAIHMLSIFCGTPSRFFSSVTKLETALRATCSFTLSGFTRSIRVSSLFTLTMVPTIPPVVTTTLPFSSVFSICCCCFFWRCMGMNTSR